MDSRLNAGADTPAVDGALDARAAQVAVLEHFGLSSTAWRLDGEREENYGLQCTDGTRYVLKATPCGGSGDELQLAASALEHLARQAPSLPVPRLLRDRLGRLVTRLEDDFGRTRHAMVYGWLPGRPLIDSPRIPGQWVTCGRLLGALARALGSFESPLMHRSLPWDLRQLEELQPRVECVQDVTQRAFVTTFLERHVGAMRSELDCLPRQFVHNDFNARNILVDQEDPARVTGLIDFGDALFTARAADVAVGIVGQLAHPDTASAAQAAFIGAYLEAAPLTRDELALLDWLVAGRLVQNCVMTAWYRARDPEGHFADFGPEYFAWRIEYARHLTRGRLS